MNLEKQKAFIIHVVYIVLILVLGYIGIKYVLPLLMPFVIGMIIAVIFRRPIDFISKKTRIHRTAVSIIILLLLYGLLGFIISMAGFKTAAFLGDLLGNVPKVIDESIKPAIKDLTDKLSNQSPNLKIYIDNFMNNLNDSIFNYITNASSAILSKLTSLAGQIPSLLIKLIFTIVSSFFFTIDYYRMTRFIVGQFKGERREMILKLKDNGLGTLGKFIRAYSIIISVTFSELSIGFWIIGISNPFLFGLLVAIIDILPILGTGAVLLPWSIISLIMGNTKVGIGMLILYIVITAVRQTIEPRIVGQQIGLHPIVTLLLMYVGAQLMGVLGLLLLPIIATLLLKLNEEGTINLLKKVR
jgi:sporulation integral membrane protein YtvI